MQQTPSMENSGPVDNLEHAAVLEDEPQCKASISSSVMAIVTSVLLGLLDVSVEIEVHTLGILHGTEMGPKFTTNYRRM